MDFGLCLCLVWVSVFVFVFWHGFRALFAFRVSVSGVGFGLCISGWVSSLGFSWLFSIWVAHIFAFFFFPSFSNLDFAHISARFFFCFFFFPSLVLDEFWPQWWRCNCTVVFVALIAVVVVFYIILLCC